MKSQVYPDYQVLFTLNTISSNCTNNANTYEKYTQFSSNKKKSQIIHGITSRFYLEYTRNATITKKNPTKRIEN